MVCKQKKPENPKIFWLDKLFFNELDVLSVKNYWKFTYNHERPHSGLGGAMIKPWPQDEDGEVVMFTRLGGFLKSYRRVRKKAA